MRPYVIRESVFAEDLMMNNLNCIQYSQSNNSSSRVLVQIYFPSDLLCSMAYRAIAAELFRKKDKIVFIRR